jgi:hypothetical protein
VIVSSTEQLCVFVCLCYCSGLFSVRDLCDGVISGSVSNFDLVHMFTVISDI